MPYLSLPDGSYLTMQPGETESSALARAQQQFPDAFPVDTSQAQTGFFPAMKAGAQQYGAGLGYLAGMAGGVSDEAMRQAAAQQQRQQQQQFAPTSMRDVEQAYKQQGAWGGAKSLGQLWLEQMGQSLPAMGAIGAGAVAGGAAGTALGGPPGGLIGGVLGGFAGAYPAQIEQMVGRQIEAQPTGEINRGAALTGAAGASALDVAEQIAVLGRIGVGKAVTGPIRKFLGIGEGAAAEKVLSKQAHRSLAATLGRGAVRGVAVEVPTEIAQQVIEREQAGLPLLSPDAIQEYQDTAISVAGPGAVFGGVGGVSARGEARTQLGELQKRQKEQAERVAREVRGVEAYGNLLPGMGQQLEQERMTGVPLFGKEKGPYAPTEYKPTQAELEQEGQSLLRQQEVMRRQADQLQEAAASATDPAQAAQLAEQHLQLKKALGTADTRLGELEKQGVVVAPVAKRIANQERILKKLQAQLQAAQDKGDTERIASLGRRVAALTPQLEQLRAQAPAPSNIQPDLFAAAEEQAQQRAQAAQTFDQQQAALQKQQEQMVRGREQAVQRWQKGLTAVEEQRAEQEAQQQRQADQQARIQRFIAAETTTPIDRPGAEPTEGRKVATARYQKLIESVDEGNVNKDLIRALGLNLKESADITTPEGAVAALPAIEARVNEVRGVLEGVDPDQLTGKAAVDAVKVDQVLKELRRLQDTANRTLREQPRDLGVFARIRKEEGDPNTVLGVDPTQPGQELQRRAEAADTQSNSTMSDFAQLVDDMRKGVFFGGPKPGGASSTINGLRRRADGLVEDYVSNFLRTVAYERARNGQPPLTAQEAREAGAAVSGALMRRVRSADNFAGKMKRDQMELRNWQRILNDELAKETPRAEEVAKIKKKIAGLENMIRRRETLKRTRGPEGAVLTGVRPEEVAVWNQEIDRVRNRLLAAKRPYQVVPATELTLRRPTPEAIAARQPQGLAGVSAKVAQILGMPNLNPEVQATLQEAKDIIDRAQVQKIPTREQPARRLVGLVSAQADRILNGVDQPFMPTRDVTQRGNRPGPIRTAELLPRIQEELRNAREAQQFTPEAAGRQGELFPPGKGTIRATAENFRRFLNSKIVQKMRAAIAARKQAQTEERLGPINLLHNLLRQQQAQPENILEAMRERVRRMYPVRQELQKALVHEIPQSVVQREIAKAQALLRWGIQQLPGLDATPAEIEASQLGPQGLEGLQQEVRQLVDDANSIDAVYREPITALSDSIQQANKHVETEKQYLQTLQESIKNLRGELAARRRSEITERAKRLRQAEALLTKERDAAAAIDRLVQQRIGERFGLPTIERTVQLAETYNPKTGERTLAKTPVKVYDKMTGKTRTVLEPVQQKVTRTIPPRESPRAEIEKLNEQARAALEERRVPAVKKLQGEIQALKRDVDTRSIQLMKVRKQAEQTFPAYRAAANRTVKRLEKELAKAKKALADRTDILKKWLGEIEEAGGMDVARQGAEARAAANEEARRALVALGEMPGTRAGKQGLPLRTGTEEQAQQLGEASQRAKASRRANREYLEGGPPELNFEDGNSPDGTAFRKAKTPETPVDPKEAQDAIDKIKDLLPENVKFTYYPTREGMPPLAKRWLDAAEKNYRENEWLRGAVLPTGRVIIIGDAHGSLAELQETLWHELIGHYGVDTVLGPKGWKALSDSIWENGLDGVRQIAKNLGIENQVESIIEGERALQQWLQEHADIKHKRTAEDMKLAISREIVADAITYNQNIPPAAKGLMGVIKKIVNAVRKLFSLWGMKAHANLTTQQIYDALRQSANAFKFGDIGPYRAPSGDAAFSTARVEDVLPGIGTGPDNLIGNTKVEFDKTKMGLYGLAIEVEALDSQAALSKAIQAALVKEGLSPTDFKWAQTMSDTRAIQDTMHHATDFLSTGDKGIVRETLPDGRIAETYGRTGKGGPSLYDVIKPLSTVSKDHTAAGKTFTYYGVIKRAERVGWTKVNLEAITGSAQNRAEFMAQVDKFKEWLKNNPDKEQALAKAFDLYQDYNHNLLDLLGETEALPRAKIAELKSTRDYMPFYRINPSNANAVQLWLDEGWTNIGDLTHQPYLKQLLGGSEQIMDFFESSIQNTHVLIDKAISNRAAKSAASTLVDLGLTEGGVRDGYGPENANSIRFNVEPSPEELAKKGWSAGQRHVVISSDHVGIPSNLVVHGLRGTAMQMPAAVRFLGIPGSWVRKWVTRNPMYAVRQLYNDMPSLLFPSGAPANLSKVLGSLAKTATLKNPTVGRLQSMGLIGGNVYTGTQEDLERISRAVVASHDKKFSWAKFMGGLDRMAITADSFSRAHIFDSLRSTGMSEMEAALATREALDFSRRGRSPTMRMMTSIMPFANTQMQALYALAKAATGKMPFEQRLQIKKKFFQRGALLAAMTLAYAMMKQDDEAYKNASPYERYYYWFVNTPLAKEPIRIRIPFEPGVVFKAIPEALYDMAAGDTTTKEAVNGMGRTMFNSYPYSIPPAFKLMIEQAFNINTFTGRPIETESMQKLEPFLRYNARTTETAKLLSRGMYEMGIPQVSPQRIENVINNFTTGTGLALLSAMDVFTRPLIPEGAGRAEGKASTMPIFGRAFQPTDAGGKINAMYEMAKEAEEKSQTFNQLIKTGKGETARQYAMRYAREIALGQSGGPIRAYRNRMDKLRQQQRMIEEAPESRIPPTRKRELLDKIRQAQILLSDRYRTALIRAGI